MRVRGYMLFVVAGTVLLALGIGLWPRPRPALRSATPVIEAVIAFCRDRAARGIALPPTVSLRQLSEDGFLSPKVLAQFGAADVEIALTADETRSQSVLTTARMPDGTYQLGLADGSTHLLSAEQMAAASSNTPTPVNAPAASRFQVERPFRRVPE